MHFGQRVVMVMVALLKRHDGSQQQNGSRPLRMHLERRSSVETFG